MKNKNFYWIAGTIAVVSLSLAGTLFVVQRRRLHDEVDEVILYIREHKGDQRSLDVNKGFSPEYYKKTLQQRLSFDTVKSIGDDIHNAISGIGANASKVYAALGRVSNLSQLSQVAEYYYQKTKGDYLLDDLKGQWQISMSKIFDIVGKLK
jgi:hypothetical protein